MAGPLASHSSAWETAEKQNRGSVYTRSPDFVDRSTGSLNHTDKLLSMLWLVESSLPIAYSALAIHHAPFTIDNYLTLISSTLPVCWLTMTVAVWLPSLNSTTQTSSPLRVSGETVRSVMSALSWSPTALAAISRA